MSTLTGRLFSAIVVASVLIALINLATPSYELRLYQQTTSTAIMNGQTFGCNGGTCSLVGGTWTATQTGITTTYTLTVSGTIYTVTFVQGAATATNSLAITVTYPTSFVSPNPNPSCNSEQNCTASDNSATVIALGLLFVACIVIAIVVLASRSHVRPKAVSPKEPTLQHVEQVLASRSDVRPKAASPKDPTLQHDEQVLEYLKFHNGQISIRAASQDLGLSEAQLKESISHLSEKGVIASDQAACPFCGNVNPPFAEHFCVKCGKALK